MTAPDPKLPRIAPDKMPADIREMWARSIALRGEATFFEVMANAPDFLRWYIDQFYGSVFYSERVPIEVFEVLRLRLSATHGCKFCNQGNREAAKTAGLSDAEIDALFTDDLSALSSAQLSVVELADQLNLQSLNGVISEKLHKELSEHFSSAQIVEMGLVGAMLSGIAKFLFAFDLVEREEHCPIPRANPPTL